MKVGDKVEWIRFDWSTNEEIRHVLTVKSIDGSKIYTEEIGGHLFIYELRKLSKLEKALK